MLDGSVPGAQSRLAVAQGFAPGQSGEDVRGHVSIDVEVGDRSTDVLLGLVTQQVELGAIRPPDDAVGTEAVKRDRGALDEIAKLLRAEAQRAVGV
ncbi:MAG TPA: hypothetical protein VIF57_22290 [Polyangia bacterium]